jgi:hypothetical protein
LLWKSLLATAAIFALLQAWRPYFFLTDDNLTAGFPFLSEVGRHLLHGESPFFTDHLFGCHYNLLRDPTFFAWHPFCFLAALLTATPLRFFAIDLLALFSLLISVSGFVMLADHLRRERGLPLGDGRILFLALSLNFSLYLLTIGSSWAGFLTNNSVLPWLVLGLLLRSARAGIGLVTLFTLHEILGGHPEPTISNGLMLSLLALGLAVDRRTARPLLVWAAGNLLALLIVSPLLAPALEGFLHTTRSAGLDPARIGEYRISFWIMLFSMLAGTLSGMLAPHSFTSPDVFAYSFYLAFAAAWYLLLVLLSRERWTALPALCLGLMGLLLLLIGRPHWVDHILARLPLLRSMRWPFREILQFNFFAHLLMVLRTPAGSRQLQRACLLFGSAIFIVPFFFSMRPTINPMEIDRAYLLSGHADAYWAKVRPLFQPGDRYVVIEDFRMCAHSRIGVPNILLGSYDYPLLFELPSDSGYSPTAPLDQVALKTFPFWLAGVYTPDSVPALQREVPDLKFITLVSITPLKVELSSAHGPTIDLTPFAR